MSGQGTELELTPLQQAYWIGEQEGVELGGVVPHVYVEYDIDGCDLKRLESAWWQLVARHEGLRAVITSEGLLKVLSELPARELPIHDLRAASAEERARELEATRSRMTHTGPSCRRWPMFEIQVSRVTDSVARLHLTVNLLIQDAHSWAVLPRELYALYTDPATTLAPIRSLGCHRARLAALRQTDRFREAWNYWRARLATLPPAPQLPQAKSPAAISATRFTARERMIASISWEALRANAKVHRLTPSAALTMVYADVLAKYSRSPHFTLNLLSSLRGELEAHGAIDNLSSTLLLEVQPAPRDQTFEQRARLLQRQLMRDVEHSIVGGVEIIRESARLQQAAARASMPIVFASALFDEEEHLPGWTKLQNRVQTPHVLIDYHARIEAGAAVLHWETIDEVYPDGLIDDMFADYCERVERLAADPASWRSPLQTPIPSSQLARRQAVNSTAAPLTDELLHHGIERQVRDQPDAPAVIATDRVLTYRELSRRAGAIARWLVDAGATGGIVSVLMERGWEQVAAVLGILRAGAAYLPLDPGFPSHRVAHILDQASCRHVLLRAPCQLDTSGWPAGARQCRVDDLAPLDHDGELADRGRPDDLAYVIYTSGSTGSPKGVVISHRGAVNTVQDINERFAIRSSDRVLALSLLNFDLSVWDIFGTLRAGGAVVIPSAAGARDPAHWSDLVRRHRITVWNSVPAYMQMLAEHCATIRGGSGFSTVRLVLMSGDWIPTTLPEQIAKIAPAAKIISLGGATEASIWSIIHEIDQVDPAWKSIPYGRPLRNQWFHVLDENLEHRPDLVPGHLYIGGVGLALGYYRDEALTRASFLTHPVTGERLYRTGDWGCYHPSGDIELLGREDGQVKVRGFRIELGEIETVLRTHHAVQDAVVIVSDDRGDRRLVAYLVTDLQVDSPTPFELDPASQALEKELTVEHLRRFARARLPEYMVPSGFVLLDRLPLSPNGKVDRRALPAWKVQEGPRRFIAPRTELESELAGIWEELLGHSPIGIRDSFFELGGHSLLALRLTVRLQERSSVVVPLSTFFRHSTIEALARLIETGERFASSTPLVPIQPRGSKSPVFCVHPSGGNVLCYHELARRLGDDQPVFGLEAAEPVDGAPSCEAMAGSYVAAIRQVRPSGPYRLAGWSTGGVVAFEIARQLSDVGEEVDLLVLIDSWANALTNPHEETPADLPYQFARDIVGARLDALAALEHALDGADANSRLARTIEWLASSGAAAGVERAELERIYRIFSSNVRAAAAYQPKPLAVRTLLLVCGELASDEFPDPAAQPSLGWDRVIPAASLEVARVAGDHYTLLRDPRVAAVAELLSRSFDRRQRMDTVRTPSEPSYLNLSAGQQSIRILRDHDHLDAPAYNVALAARVTDRFDPPALLSACELLSTRRFALRSALVRRRDEVVQIVRPAVTPDFAIVPLEGDVDGWIRAEVARPFDIERGPLFRMRVGSIEPRRHIVLLVGHELVVDVESLAIIFREWMALHRAQLAVLGSGDQQPVARASDEEVPLHEPADPEREQRDRGYWERRRGELAHAATVWSDPAYAGGPPHAAGRVPCCLDRDLLAAARELAASSGVGLDAVLAAALLVVLHRHTGREDVVIGWRRSRPHRSLYNSVGSFALHIPLRVDLADRPDFPALVARTGAAMREAADHGSVCPIAPQRSPSFAAMLSFVDADQGLNGMCLAPLVIGESPVEVETVRVDPLPVAPVATTLDLTLVAGVVEDRLVGSLVYRADRYPELAMRRVAGHLETVLRAALAQPDQPICRLRMTTDAEREQLLRRWNVEPPAEPFDAASVMSLIADQVVARPEAVAVVGEEEALTYRELDRRAARVAARLRELGDGTDWIAAICLDRSPSALVAILGILQAGGAYLPLDPTFPDERIRFMVRDSQARALLVDQRAHDRLQGIGCPLVRVDASAIADMPEGSAAAPTRLDSLAYVIYTSGSTGRPKGVMIEHRSLASFTRWAMRAYAIRPDDRLLQFASFSVDTSVEEIFPTLAAGATLVLRSRTLLDTPGELFRFCDAQQLTVLDLPTAFWHVLVGEMVRDGRSPPASLRLIIIGGEAALAETVHRWARHVGDRVVLLNTYGLTETTVIATCGSLSAADARAGGAVSIGTSIRGAETYVLDPHLEPVPLGVVGEIHVGGAALARGYLGRPDLTAERFIRHTFTTRTAARLLRTGDLGRRREDGAIEHLGRMDHQVKLRGYRVELGEIESALERHPGVRQAVVTAVSDGNGQRLVAYFVSDRAIGPNELRSHLARQLPEYLVPARFLQLEALPLTRSGKIDRSALPTQVVVSASDRGEAPSSPIECALAAIWSAVLRIEQVGRHDNFIDLGGHSLLALSVLSQIRSTFDVELRLYELVEAASLSEVAALIAERTAPR